MSAATKRSKAKQQRTPKWRDKKKVKAIEDAARRLGMTIEHIYPLRGKTVSGLHVHNNLAIMWEADNMEKGNEMPNIPSTQKVLTSREHEIKLQNSLIRSGSIKTCTNCEHWRLVHGMKTLLGKANLDRHCGKYSMVPPPDVIVTGCVEHVEDIPF